MKFTLNIALNMLSTWGAKNSQHSLNICVNSAQKMAQNERRV